MHQPNVPSYELTGVSNFLPAKKSAGSTGKFVSYYIYFIAKDSTNQNTYSQRITPEAISPNGK